MAGSKTLTIALHPTGTELTDFPNLITGEHMPQVFWDNVESDGADIILYDSASNKLKRELVSIDVANKTMELYVKKTRSATAPTLLTMEYDDAAGAETNDADTWNANYAMVHHMNDDPDTSTIQDSTTNNNDGAKSGAGQPPETTGVFGGDKAQTCISTEYITVADSVSLSPASEITIMAVIKPSDFTDTRAILTKLPHFFEPYRIFLNVTTGVLSFQISKDAATREFFYGTALTAGVWSYIAAVFKTGANNTFVTVNTSVTTSTPSVVDAIRDTVDSLRIGADSRGKGLAGDISEVRISNSALSAAWLLAEYNSLLNNASTYHVVTPNTQRIVRKLLAMHG